MRNFGALRLAISKSGLKAGLAHLAAICLGDPIFFRPPSMHDLRRSDSVLVPDPMAFLRTLFPNESIQVIEDAISFSEKNLEQFKDDSTGAGQPLTWNSGTTLQLILGAVTYILRPKIILETGTANGISTRAMAAAVSKLEPGHIWSVDILENVGGAIPENLKKNISFIHSSGKFNEMKNNLDFRSTELNNSFFLHDADHSYSAQTQDYTLARELGFTYIISDDVDASFAFVHYPMKNKVIMVDGNKVIGAGMVV